MNTNMNKIVEVNYNRFRFTVDFTKRGVPDVYWNGKLLRPVLNQKLNRNHFSLSLPISYAEHPGVTVCSNGYGCLYHVYCYRIIAAAMEVLKNGSFDYEKFKSLQIDHIDGNPSNDVPSNLRWMTRKANNSRKLARQRRHLNFRNTSHRNELILATKDGEEVLYKNGMRAAKGIGCSHVLIYRCLNPEDYATTAKGWKLEYVPLSYGILDKSDLEG